MFYENYYEELYFERYKLITTLNVNVSAIIYCDFEKLFITHTKTFPQIKKVSKNYNFINLKFSY